MTERKSRVKLGAVLILCAMLAPAVLCAKEYSLDDLYASALARSETLKTAEENVVIATLTTEKARALLIPNLTSYGSLTQFSESKYSDPSSLDLPGYTITMDRALIQPDRKTEWGVRLDQAFSLSGRELIALKIARQNVTRSRDDLTALREEYLLRVAAAYFNALLAGRDLEIADANVERLTTYRNAAEKRLKVGEITKTVLLRADAELSGAKSDRLRAANGRELAMAVLARVAGIEGPYTIKEEAAVREELPSLEALQDTALAERTDLRSQEMAKIIAQEQVRFTRGSFWPTISFLGGYSRYDQHPVSSSLNRESAFGTVSLNFPLFEGGLRKAEVKEARAKERQAAYLYDDLRKSVAIEVEEAYLAYLTQKGTLTFVDDEVTFARDNYRGVVRQFESGLASSLDVIDANTTLVSAERTAVSAYYRYQLARLHLLKATGEFIKRAVKTSS